MTTKPAICILALAAIGALGCQRANNAAVVQEPTEPAQDESMGTLHGTVIDIANGEPVAVAEILVSSNGEIVARGTTDGDGNYRLQNVPPGQYRIDVRYGGLTTTAEDVLVVKGGGTPLRMQLDSRANQATADGHSKTDNPRGTIAGVLRERAAGPGFSGATVEAERDGKSVLTISGDGGKFRFIGLEPGIYNVSVYYTLVDKGTVEVRRAGVEVTPYRETTIELTVDTDTQR